MAVTRPRSMVANTLNPKKGWGASMQCLDFSAKISSAVEFVFYSGRVGHLNPSGEVISGCHDGAGMSLFHFPNQDDPDVSNPGGDPETEPDAWVDFVEGTSFFLVASGGYEVETTEFDAGENFPPNTPVTSANDDTDVDVGGILTPGTLYTDHICGVVSTGVGPSNYLKGKEALSLWTVWLPPTP